ncbi:S-adenosylmethionine:tRNA ribosyltransferase-isomerase [Thermotomaculum hydrothermale]|uniref:S-adenosylmethionine:tRNA ribosyltransferase-isomerase n=1 Tax=Thermotomaculum hydrothermale TaxID=981385 RepID=A0A7R6SYP4_9BACT|nr:tRNA preQ1(34) S-adenosylmethionine ribosyltransferase-isomerase QueA [Thermotomaculum hydrothermale]BBB32875.1 S-adenosylmethionine:tRNA ribosyltransferase-isomerase [Thermotomaculum hydrothermale]
MRTDEFDYNLPQELIAQKPRDQRDKSRMMVLNRKEKSIEHKIFYEFPEIIPDNTMIVLNNTKVFPARLYLTKRETGAKIEVFLLKQLDKEAKRWKCMIKPSKRVKKGTVLEFENGKKVIVEEKFDEGIHYVFFDFDNPFEEIFKYGKTPLPPYIKREPQKDFDPIRYQTVFAEKTGAVAAPTAGFHFTESVLKRLEERGIPVRKVTLYVGLGTFKPVTVDIVEKHKMDSEHFEISKEVARDINEWKKKGGKILAVGTTVVRTLEGCFAKYGEVRGVSDETDIFIYPPYEFKVIDYLLTNFHLPKSTLIMLVSAFAGKDFVFNAYNEAVRERYRFYSYGDCMLIL